MKNHITHDCISVAVPKIPIGILTAASSFCSLHLALRAVANEPIKICLRHNFDMAKFPLYALSGYNKALGIFNNTICSRKGYGN